MSKKWNLFGTTKEPEEKTQNPNGGFLAGSSAKTTDPDMEAFKAEAERAEPTGDYIPLGGGMGLTDKEGAEAGPTSPVMLEMMWKMLFSTIAGRAGDHWQLSKEEAKQLGEASGPVIDKYLPSVINKYGAELILAWTVSQIVIPRVARGSVESEGQKKKDSDHHGAARGGEVNAPERATA